MPDGTKGDDGKPPTHPRGPGLGKDGTVRRAVVSSDDLAGAFDSTWLLMILRRAKALYLESPPDADPEKRQHAPAYQNLDWSA